MKSTKYFMIALFILSFVFVADHSNSQPWTAPITGVTRGDIGYSLSGFGATPGPGSTRISLYGQSKVPGWNIFAASRMIWSQLRTSRGEYLAEISGLLVDPASGRISNIELSRIQGMGTKDVVIPFSNVSKTGDLIFVHNAPEEEFLPRLSGEPPYTSEGLHIYAQQPVPTGSYPTTKLMGATVRTSKGEEFGKIDDVVIDPKDGHIVYFIVSQAGGKMAALPFSLLSKRDEKDLTLNVGKEKLAAAPAFEWSAMADRKYAEKVYKHYGVNPYWE